MPNQWSGTIATQAVPFRGTSAVGVKSSSTAFPNPRAVLGAVYGLNVVGGFSGNFSCVVAGNIGGTTHLLAGVSAITAIGTYVLFPFGYSVTGAVIPLPSPLSPLDGLHRLDVIVPPSYVYFIANTSTAGISANCTVSAVFQTP